MRILAVSDEENKALWDFYQPGKLAGIDLILSAGDLKPEYLSFLVTMANRPLLYIHGNHDKGYLNNPPEGCDCVEDRVVTVKGLRIIGLGGTMIHNEGFNSFNERQMERRIRKLRGKIRKAGGVDIILTHAPVRGYGDEDYISHRGYEAFLKLIEEYRPAVLVHGHVHKSYTSSFERCLRCGDTQIINASGSYIFDFPDRNA